VSFAVAGSDACGDWSNEPRWYVYLFALTDCSGFKAGFTCNPFQRIHTFSRRYYERFDLRDSALLALDKQPTARNIESELKARFATSRVACPDWVPREAGGHTEWFGAFELNDARERLRAHTDSIDGAAMLNVFDYLRAQLSASIEMFEPWALAQAHTLHDLRVCDAPQDAVTQRSLRDWLDAYRHFDVPLFAEDEAAREFVRAGARVR
jgi:hypothetical protein